MPEVTPDPSLRVAGSRWRLAIVAVLTTIGLAAAAGWYATHPDVLPPASGELRASTPAGEPLYVGLLRPASGRPTLTLRSVVTRFSGDDSVQVEPLICRDGAVTTTGDAAPYCREIDQVAGASLGPSDSLLLQVSGDQAGIIDISPVRISYRAGLRWATEQTGPSLTVAVISRSAG